MNTQNDNLTWYQANLRAPVFDAVQIQRLPRFAVKLPENSRRTKAPSAGISGKFNSVITAPIHVWRTLEISNMVKYAIRIYFHFRNRARRRSPNVKVGDALPG